MNLPKEDKNDCGNNSAKDVKDEDVGDILADVDQFIEGVYRDLSMTPPRESASQRTSSSNLRRSVDNDSFKSTLNNLSDVASSLDVTSSNDDSVAKKSPIVRRSIDAEIERIDRICNNVDQNLRSIGLFMNTSCTSNSSEQPLSTNLTSSQTSVLGLDCPPITTTARSESRRKCQRVRQSLSTVVSQVIDLSESQTQTPEIRKLTNANDFNDNDDDVILVSGDIHPVVDLCTPSGHRDVTRNRITRNNSQLSRRRLPESDVSVIELNDDAPTTARRRCTGISARSRHVSLEDSLSPDRESNSDEVPSTETTEPGRTPFMCPVCMESCLQRKPTSTKCGHVFCNQCIKRAIRLTNKCPMCNGKILKHQLFRIYL